MERFPKIKHRKLGTVSMTNNGQDMHGSQVIKLKKLKRKFNFNFNLIVLNHAQSKFRLFRR